MPFLCRRPASGALLSTAVLLFVAAAPLAARAQGTVYQAGTAATNVFTPVYNFSVTTDINSPRFNRPAASASGTSQPSGLSGTGTAVGYATGAFTTGADATYQFTTTTTGYDPGNFAQYIYTGFNPASPLTNAQFGIFQTGLQTLTYYLDVPASFGLQIVNTGFYNATETTPGRDSLGASTTTVSQVDTNPGTTTQIVDATFSDTGTTTPGVTTFNLNITDNYLVGALNSVTIFGLQHSLIGDLTAQLVHNGTTIDLFSRVGLVDPNDEFDTGDDSNFGAEARFTGDASAVGEYTFTINGASLESAVAAGNTSFFLPSGTYGADTTTPGFGFAGQEVNGLWQLVITDSSAGETGSLAGFRLNVSAPEPGSLLLLAPLAALSGLSAARRRRRAA